VKKFRFVLAFRALMLAPSFCYAKHPGHGGESFGQRRIEIAWIDLAKK
jgi:hypothetical protein